MRSRGRGRLAFRRARFAFTGGVFTRALAGGAVVLALAACAAAPQDSKWTRCSGDPEMLAAVKAEFLHVWNHYKERAYGRDEINPVRGLYRDLAGQPLAMTLVDSLDALWIMGERDEFDAAVAWIEKNLSFDVDAEIETPIAAKRLLGGLLAAYELSGEDVLLVRAEQLGQRLRRAFDSPTGLPYARVNLKTGAASGPRIAPADAAVIDLAFSLLSRHTGDFAFARMSRAAMLFVWERRSALGLMGASIDVETAEWVDRESHVDEGLGACYRAFLIGGRLFDDDELDRLNASAFDAAQRVLREPRQGVPWYGATHMEQGVPRRPYLGSSSAFWPGYLAQAGAIEEAVRLQEAWFKVWTRFGGEPKYYDYEKQEILNPAGVLEPGFAWSALVLWRLTGDPQYREQGRRILADLVAYYRAPFGYAGLSDVAAHEIDEGIVGCFPGETLKVLYLLFAPCDVVDFDRWILVPGTHPARL